MIINPKNLCQIEIRVTNLERSLTFYNQVFSWQPVPAEIHNYIVMAVPDDCPFGITLVPNAKAGESGDRVILYFAVEDPETLVDAAIKFGGALRRGPKRLPSYGTVWQIRDPDGNTFGLFKKTSRHPPLRA